MSHILIDEDKLTDPYFTHEEWSKVLKKREKDFDTAKKLLCQEDISIEERRYWVANVEAELTLCNCIVHADDEKYSVLARLVEVSAPLTDDSGFRLINSLLPYILKVAGMGEKILVESVRSGGEAYVYYLLQLPSGETSVCSGWPDFRLAHNYPAFERRLGRHVLRREETTRAVEEIQSPPGSSAAQTGIYTVGQFALLKGRVSEKRKVAAILLYKDMTIHVAVATLDPLKVVKGSMGEVRYKLVDSVTPYDLRNETDLAQFASVFVSVLKETN